MVKKIVSFDQLLLGMGAIWWVSISTLQHLKGNFTLQFPKSLIISKCNPSTSPVPATFFQDPQEPHAPPNHPTIHLLSTATAFGQLLLHKRSQFLWDDEVFSYSCGSCVIRCSSSVDSSDHLQYLSDLSSYIVPSLSFSDVGSPWPCSQWLPAELFPTPTPLSPDGSGAQKEMGCEDESWHHLRMESFH